MTTTFFTESITETPVKKESGRWLVSIATPGQGSSGFYSEDVLREYGPVAFPAGAKSFINHESKRDMRDCIGIFPEGAYWDENHKKLMGELQPFSHWKQFVDEVGPHSGMSIYMAGEADDDMNVTKLLEHRQNGADLVAYPGLEGSGFVEMLESARIAGSENPPAALAEENDGKDATRMDEAQFNELKALLTQAVANREATVQEAAQVEADEKLAQERIDAFESAVEAIDGADLTPAQKKNLRAQAKAGSDVAPLIEAAVALKAEILQESGVEEQAAGRILGSQAKTFNTGTIWGSK